MKKNEPNSNQGLQQVVNKLSYDPEGYPLYPENEDIYAKFKKEKRIDPEDVTKLKVKEFIGNRNEKDFIDDITWKDLDIPEIETVDVADVPDIDDEENNYYSLGGDDHNDLEENSGI